MLVRMLITIGIVILFMIVPYYAGIAGEKLGFSHFTRPDPKFYIWWQGMSLLVIAAMLGAIACVFGGAFIAGIIKMVMWVIRG